MQTQSIKSTKASIKVLRSSIPGRIRVRIETLYRAQSFANQIESKLKQCSGIYKVQANPLTRHVLVTFNSREHKTHQIVKLIRKILLEKPNALDKNQTPSLIAPSSTPHNSNWYLMDLNEIALRAGVSLKKGLSPTRVQYQRNRFGANILPTSERRSDLSIFLNQFHNLPVALLMGSAVLSLFTGGVIDAAVIGTVVIINGWIGYRMESSAERTIHSILKADQAKARVIRGGKQIDILPEDLVFGDIILLSPGSTVPADARLIQIERLTIDESFLTGESLPVFKSPNLLISKNLPIGERANMVFKGSTVTGGSGLAITVGVGSQTEIGNIQRLITASEQPRTPLQMQLERLGNQMVFVCLLASGTVFAVGLMRRHPLIELLKTSISLAVAAIPESLPTVATMTLARGIKNLEQHHVLVRSLDAIETLANVNVVCFDKTGTLTMNQMEVVAVSTWKTSYKVSSFGFLKNEKLIQIPNSEDLAVSKLIQVAVLCNEAKPPSDQETQSSNGSSTESALLRMAHFSKLDSESIRKKYPTLSTQYRSENHQFMKTVHKKDNQNIIAIKGSPDQVLSLCNRLHTGSKTRRLSKKDRAQILLENERMARQGLRVLGFAYGQDENKFTWLGLVGMMDPLRAGIIELLPRFHKAGIETRLITGDQRSTAEAIGKTLGLKKIFAQVSPSKKLKLIQELQNRGKVVAMIGDGINDGPALRNANVGVAMAARGSDVASQAADIVLPSDNLEGMLLAIQEGRTVHQDIKKAINYIITQNLSELLHIFASLAIGNKELFTSMQFLWMNLVTDIFPELALAQEPADGDVMSQPPEDLKLPLLDQKDIQRLALEASILAGASLMAYAYGFARDGSENRAKSLSFMTITTSSFYYTISARSETHTIFDKDPLRQNKYVPMAIGAGFLAELAGLFTPGLRRLLGMQEANGTDLILSTVGSIAPILLIETTKFVRKRLVA